MWFADCSSECAAGVAGSCDDSDAGCVSFDFTLAIAGSSAFTDAGRGAAPGCCAPGTGCAPGAGRAAGTATSTSEADASPVPERPRRRQRRRPQRSRLGQRTMHTDIDRSFAVVDGSAEPDRAITAIRLRVRQSWVEWPAAPVVVAFPNQDLPAFEVCF